MSNHHIVSLSEGGVGVRCEGPAKQIADIYGLNARDKLKSMLDDPERFAAAHAALTEITGFNTGSNLLEFSQEKHVAGKVNQIVYRIDSGRKLSFNFNDNRHLKDWWINSVGSQTGDGPGIHIQDEFEDEMVWEAAGKSELGVSSDVY